MIGQRKIRAFFGAGILGAGIWVALLGTLAATKAVDAAPATRVLWLNHFELQPGKDEVSTSHELTLSCPFQTCLVGQQIESTTLGDTFADGQAKVVLMAAGVPPGFDITGVRVCYELSNAASFITAVRLAQVNTPPANATVMLDDGSDLTSPGPVCSDTGQPPDVFMPFGPVHPENGAVLLSLRVNFGDTAHKIIVRGLALLLQKAGGN